MMERIGSLWRCEQNQVLHREVEKKKKKKESRYTLAVCDLSLNIGREYASHSVYRMNSARGSFEYRSN